MTQDIEISGFLGFFHFYCVFFVAFIRHDIVFTKSTIMVSSTIRRVFPNNFVAINLLVGFSLFALAKNVLLFIRVGAKYVK